MEQELRSVRIMIAVDLDVDALQVGELEIPPDQGGRSRRRSEGEVAPWAAATVGQF